MTTPAVTPPGQYSVYTGRVTNWPMTITTSIAAALIVVMAINGDGQPTWAITVPLALVAVGVVANVLTASSIRTTAGPNGVTVHWGIVGWPRTHYSADVIDKAEVIDLPSWRVSWGFWWTPRRTSCTVRSGPTLRLTLANNRTITITVPDPAAAATVLTPRVRN